MMNLFNIFMFIIQQKATEEKPDMSQNQNI